MLSASLTNTVVAQQQDLFSSPNLFDITSQQGNFTPSSSENQISASNLSNSNIDLTILSNKIKVILSSIANASLNDKDSNVTITNNENSTVAKNVTYQVHIPITVS